MTINFTGRYIYDEYSGSSTNYGVTTYGRRLSAPGVDSIVGMNSNKRGSTDNVFYFTPTSPSFAKTEYQMHFSEMTQTGMYDAIAHWFSVDDYAGNNTLAVFDGAVLVDDDPNTLISGKHDFIAADPTGIGVLGWTPPLMPDQATIRHIRVHTAATTEKDWGGLTGATAITPEFYIQGSFYTGSHVGDNVIVKGGVGIDNITDTGRWNTFVDTFELNPATNLPWTYTDLQNLRVLPKAFKYGVTPGDDIYLVGDFSVSVSWNNTTGASIAEMVDVDKYEIGLTPDLGWSDEMAMFKSYMPESPLFSNAQFKAYVIDKDEVALNLNLGSASITVPENIMDDVLSYGYPTYLWAIRAIDRHGNRSTWSTPRRFDGVYEFPSRFLSVETPTSPSLSPVVTIMGTRDAQITRVEVNGFTGSTRYPNEETWEYDIALSGGLNDFFVRGIPNLGRKTAYQKVSIELTTGQVRRHAVYNTFDDFGALHGADRIRAYDEDNSSYKTRIKDVFIHPAESNLIGLHHGITRELDLDYNDEVLNILPNTLPYSGRVDNLYPSIEAYVDTNKISLGSPTFVVHNELHKVDPHNLSIRLDNNPYYGPTPQIESPIGNKISLDQFDTDYEGRTITFKEEKWGSKQVWVTYAKKLEVPIGPSITIAEVRDSLNGLSYNNQTLLEVTASSSYTGMSSDGLLRGPFQIRSTQRYRDENGSVQFGTRLRWSDFSIHRLTDPNYQSRFYNDCGTVLNTRIESYVDYFKTKAHFDWERVVLDRDVWDPVSENNGAGLPNHLDAKKGWWEGTNQNFTGQYSTTVAFDRGMIDEEDKTNLVYKGIKQSEFKSGIGDDDDLKIVIKPSSRTEVLTEPDVYRANLRWEVTGQVDDATFLPDNVYNGRLFRL